MTNLERWWSGGNIASDGGTRNGDSPVRSIRGIAAPERFQAASTRSSRVLRRCREAPDRSLSPAAPSLTRRVGVGISGPERDQPPRVLHPAAPLSGRGRRRSDRPRASWAGLGHVPSRGEDQTGARSRAVAMSRVDGEDSLMGGDSTWDVIAASKVNVGTYECERVGSAAPRG